MTWAGKCKKPSSFCSFIEQCNLSMKKTLLRSVCFSFPSSPSVPWGMDFYVCVRGMHVFPQLVKLSVGKSPCWSSHFLFISAAKQATGKTTHSTYLSLPFFLSPLLPSASLPSHAFPYTVYSFPMCLHASFPTPLSPLSLSLSTSV